MIRIAIVEDDYAYTSQLKHYLKQYETETGAECVISCFSDGDEIAENYTKEYDIILMDVDMRFMDGLTAAEEIRKHDPEVVIIFITNLSQYAIKGYAVEALDYVLKPLSYYAFAQRIDRALKRMENRNRKRFLRIETKNGVCKIDVSSIYFVEVDGRELIYHTADGNITARGPLGKVETELADASFFRCNKGYLVNLRHISAVDGDMATVGGESVQVSRSKRKALLDALNDYLSEASK